jgi:hypothetical protein
MKRYNILMTNPKKKPLTDDERQAFVDNLPPDQVNADVKEVFDDAIARASQPQRSKLGTPDSDDGYSDTQTHSRSSEDTSGSRNDTSHQ